MFPRKDPGKGSSKIATWSYLDLKGGGSAAGWLAGPVEWVETHHYFRTIPCHWSISDGRLECPWCPKAPAVEWSGYVPFYGESGKPYLAIVRGYSQDVVMSLKTFDPLIVSKGKSKFDPIVITRPLGKRERYKSSLASRQEPVDIRPFLLKLWKEPALVTFFSAHPATSDTPVTPACDPVVPVDVPPELAARVAEAKRKKRGDDPVTDSIVDFVMEGGKGGRLPLPFMSRNGKHE